MLVSGGVMSKRLFIALMVASALGIPIAQPANAQWYGWSNVDNTQARILQRINLGRANGTLTAREYTRLMNQYNTIAAQEARLRMTGGRLNARERMVLQTRLSNLFSNVQRQSYDRQGRRFGYNSRGYHRWY
jgi:hypothetical protein